MADDSLLNRRAWWRTGLRWIALVAGAAVMLFPFLWMVVTSITPGGSLSSGPTLWVRDPTLDAYRELFTAIPMARMVVNSIGVSAVVTAAQVITGSMAAYAFARLEFKGRNLVFTLYLATMMVPMQVLVVPLFISFKTLNLHDTYASLILPGIATAFAVFMMKQAVEGIPRELGEAATIDGASHLRIYATIVLPLVKPSLAALTVVSFMGSWNSFLWPLVTIRSPEFKTLPLGLSSLHGQFTTDWAVVMAGAVVSVLPILVVYLFAQKHIAAGMARAGLK